jgi:16S rRNA (adenine1518-N6/adenine1519-N6)-dimethyltransferase
MPGPTRKHSIRPHHASHYVRERAALEGTARSRLQDALAARGLSPRKRFGQNFLVRDDVAERIVEHGHVRPDDVVVEIGPGAGALTPLLAQRARQVVAVEKDRGLAELLREELAELPRTEIVEADFLEYDVAEAAQRHGAERVAIVGNIPYNITTPIIERIFEQRAAIRSAVLLVQHEYAQRLAAAAGTPEYGSLTVFVRYHALLEPLMTVRAASFWPRPDVDSMLVRFILRDHPPVAVPSEELLFRIVRGSFQMRRKQLANTLEESLGVDKRTVASIGRQAGISTERRGETLTLDEFARLSRAAADHLKAAAND